MYRCNVDSLRRIARSKALGASAHSVSRICAKLSRMCDTAACDPCDEGVRK